MMGEAIDCAEVNTARWHAVVFYRSEAGLVDVHHALEELEELQSLVERGPNWDCIERIEIIRAVPPEELMTLEQAQREGDIPLPPAGTQEFGGRDG